jgi:transcription-repair coupling factor (superfamily II helicase)
MTGALAPPAPRASEPTPTAGAGRRIPDLSGLPPLLGRQAAFERLVAALAGPLLLTAVPHGAKSYLGAALVGARPGRRICWLVRDAEVGDRVAEELAAWLGDPAAVAVLEPRTALAYERSELVADETAARVAALAGWRAGRARVLVASVAALLQPTLAPDDLPAVPLELRPGSRLAPERLLAELLRVGYQPTMEVAGRGEFARRGGIVDVFPPSAELPVRIEFFGVEVESLRHFDPADQRTVAPVDRLVLLPATEFLAPRDGGRGLAARLAAVGLDPRRLPDRLARDLARFLDALDRAAGSGRGSVDLADAAEVWAPLLAPATGLDHLAADDLVVLDEPTEIADSAAFLWDQATERRAELVAAGELPDGWPAAYPDPDRVRSALARRPLLGLTWQSDPPTELEAVLLPAATQVLEAPFGWREPALPPGGAPRLAEAIERWLADPGARGATGAAPRIVVASDQAPRLAELLAEAGRLVGPTLVVREPPPAGSVVLVERSLNGGFAGGPEGLVFVTDRELFGAVRVRRPKVRRRVVPRDLLERLSPGDLVVHVDHGIARYERMVRRSTGSGDARDYVELAFAGGDRIFVPVEQLGRISRYTGGEAPPLSRLGGTEWARTKQRVRRAVTNLAEELLALYAARETATGHAFGPDTPWQAELEASFPYEETPDQLRALAEVKADMESSRPMDRLVVGDVGYGKTEVALRAAFKAVVEGKQVAVLVPTTVLADQHYQTFSQRFAAFPFVVRLLSRFVPSAEQARVVAGLRSGSVDVVIGTHRLLSRDVEFRDLGLVIVDEEQRFGVAAKERLKQLRREVDVLTLSATPIPRTLNLALAGLRDLSVIETPPEDRLPIQTRVAEASAGLVRDAILRELDRGGQVYYVHNRVETIEAQAEQLRRLLPGARIVVGHGQMPERTLEEVMRAFAAGEADVLVCTTIIESGLDIPNANTIIIDRADQLGLAQLYQLRGRVGRSNRRAYAYLLYRPRARMSDEARRRLQAIFNASELGAGFQIALADLEIRGAGNILGAEQSGHIAAVGFDLYRRLLAEAVEEARARRDGRPPAGETPAAVIDLPVEAHLPEAYVPDEAQRLDLYRRLARVREPAELVDLRAELLDRFGPLPPPVERLLEVVELRLAAEAAGIAAVGREDGWLVVRFATPRPRSDLVALLAAARMRGRGLGTGPADVVVGTGVIRVRLPGDPARAWALTRALVEVVAAPPEAARTVS